MENQARTIWPLYACTCSSVCVYTGFVPHTEKYIWFLSFLLELYVERKTECMWKIYLNLPLLAILCSVLCFMINLLRTPGDLPARQLESSKITSLNWFPWWSLLCDLQFRGTEPRGKCGGLQLQLPMKVPLETGQWKETDPLYIWLTWPTLSFPGVWEKFCPRSISVGPPKGNLYKSPCVRVALADCWISVRSAFHMHCGPTQGTFLPVWEYHFELAQQMLGALDTLSLQIMFPPP